MPYIQGSKIDEKFKGSLEDRVVQIHEAIREHMGEEQLNILVTHEDHVLAVDGNGQVVKVSFKVEGKEVVDISLEPSDAIPVIEDADIPSHVASELKALAEAAMRGEPLERTRVREVAQLVDKDEDYWLSDVLLKVEDTLGESEWHKMYQANQEKIRTSLYGNIREIEGRVPKTKFGKISAGKLNQFESELREAISILKGVTHQIIDECAGIVFDNEQDDFFSAICDSLQVEARALEGLLGKAEKLMRPEDMGQMAMAHDKLAERAKVMAVVAAYMKNRTQSNEE